MRRGRTRRHDEVNPQTDEFARESGEPIESSLSPSALKSDVLSRHVAQLAQPLPKSLEAMRESGGRAAPKKAYAGDLRRLLRGGGERRYEEPESKDEVQETQTSSPTICIADEGVEEVSGGPGRGHESLP